MCAEQVTPAVTPYRFYNPNPAAAYASLIGCYDTTSEVTGSYPTPMAGGMFGPSVFGGGLGMPFGGMMPGMGMGMMGGPGSERWYMSMLQAMDNDKEIRTKQIEHGVELSRQTQDANFRATNHNDLVSHKVAVLQELIRENNQDQIPTALESLKEAVRLKLKHDGNEIEPTEHQVDTVALKAYAEAMKGRTVLDDLHKYGDSPFMSGFYKSLGGFGWAFMENRTATQNMADIEGVKVPKSERAKELAGKIVGGVITAVGAIALWKLGKKAFKHPPIDIVTQAEAAISPAEKLAKIEAHIKGLASDPRLVNLSKKNKNVGIDQILEWHSEGILGVITDEEKAFINAYKQSQQAASKLRVDILSAQQNAALS